MNKEQLTNFIHKLLYETMDIEDYNFIMKKLGAIKKGNRYTTICHNIDGGGYNLSFDNKSRSFLCYSGCSCTYSLLSLIKKRRKLLGEDDRTIPSLKWLCNELGIECDFNTEIKPNNDIYKWNYLNKYAKNGKSDIELIEYDESILDYFSHLYHEDWIDYGISEKTLDKYNIKWYDYKNQIVIPCRDCDGRLIGIRIRDMSDNNIKYMPLQLLDGTEYNFPTNEVFFGENFNWVNCQRIKSVMIVESEKTVLKADEWFGEKNNICLALYGSVLSQSKMKKLLNWGVETFYIALDSDFTSIEYSTEEDTELTEYEKFEKKVFRIYNTIKPYAKDIYVIYNNLGFENCYKFSPTDYTREQFDLLWDSKERINDESI